MLPPEQDVLLVRQGFADAQAAMVGARTPLGFYSVGWYGSETNDERGSFAIVDPKGPLYTSVGDYLYVSYKQRGVYVYVIGSEAQLLTDLAMTRRAYMAISLLAKDPINAEVSVVG